MMPACVLALLARFERVSADDLAEKTVLLVKERQPALFELLEELIPGNLDEIFVLGARRLREHDPDDADTVVLMRALDGRRFAAVLFRPAADFLVVNRCLCHGNVPKRWEALFERLLRRNLR